jgi:hypothetical protein
MKIAIILIAIIIIIAVSVVYFLATNVFCTDGCGRSPGISLNCQTDSDCHFYEKVPVPGSPGCYSKQYENENIQPTDAMSCECVNNFCRVDDSDEKFCVLDSDCQIKYNVLYNDECSAGCFNTNAQVDESCQMLWEPIAGSCECTPSFYCRLVGS